MVDFPAMALVVDHGERERGGDWALVVDGSRDGLRWW